MQHIAFLLFFLLFFKVKAKSQRAAPIQKQKARQRKLPLAK
jgi:hypothetical protein